MPRLDSFHQLALGRELDAGIDGKRERGAGMSLGGHLGIDAAPFDVGQYHFPSLAASQLAIESHFDSGVALFFMIHRTQHVRRERPVGIVPLAFGLKIDPFQMQAAQLFRLCVWNFALHPQKAALMGVRPAHPVSQLSRVQAQNARQNLGRHAHVGNAQRVDEHRFHRDAHGQRLSGAVEDRPARRRDRHAQLLLLAGEPRIFLVMNHLQGDELREDQPGPQQSANGEPCQA